MTSSLHLRLAFLLAYLLRFPDTPASPPRPVTAKTLVNMRFPLDSAAAEVLIFVIIRMTKIGIVERLYVF